MADPTVLGQLVLDANAWCVATFGPTQEAADGGSFALLLDKGASAANILSWFKEYWLNVKSNGYDPYKVNVMLHDNNDSLRRFLLGKLTGQTFGSPVEETPADRAKQVAVLQKQLAAKLAEPPNSTAYDPAGIENIYKMLANLATKPLYKA